MILLELPGCHFCQWSPSRAVLHAAAAGTHDSFQASERHGLSLGVSSALVRHPQHITAQRPVIRLPMDALSGATPTHAFIRPPSSLIPTTKRHTTSAGVPHTQLRGCPNGSCCCVCSLLAAALGCCWLWLSWCCASSLVAVLPGLLLPQPHSNCGQRRGMHTTFVSEPGLPLTISDPESLTDIAAVPFAPPKPQTPTPVMMMTTEGTAAATSLRCLLSFSFSPVSALVTVV